MALSARPARRWFPDETFYSDERCLRCGVCCGSTDGDPCEHLRRADGGWFCEIYRSRFGPHNTVNGIPFDCVKIQRVIETSGGYDGCGYVREIRRLRQERGEPATDLGRMADPRG